ncbi:MAG: formate hydrogenase [Leptospiraceae bacterium]|nr:formate hydrogenase [Leptospiraceae bacterium]MCK6380658.1 formate hydrogenase [Leptospiraceae bacterium]NUM41528.1 formate hydrogenase [Leptospiraceae bacterium]
MINLQVLTYISILVFLIILLSFLFSPTKNQTKIPLWSFLMIVFFLVLAVSWFVTDLALQWVLIEASTLFGALLVSVIRSKKAIEVAWKFLLINSFGLGIAFLGLIILAFGVQSNVSFDSELILKKISEHDTILVRFGLWLTIFGYSAKLGLFPNLFWVSDTYAESPSQVSGIIASYIPVSVCIALRPLIKMDQMLSFRILSVSNAFLFMAILTMLYSLWTLYQTKDIRRITAQVALFHSGALGIFLWYNPTDEVFYYLLISNVVVKSLLFFTLGIFRMDSGARFLEKILLQKKINRMSVVLFLTSFSIAFALPISSVFVSDLIIIKMSLVSGYYWGILVPFCSLIFFAIGLFRFLPVLNVPAREFLEADSTRLKIRVSFSIVLFLITVGFGIFGIYIFLNGGFGNA